MLIYTVGREAIIDEEPVMRPLDVLPISITLEEDHNIVDRENPINWSWISKRKTDNNEF